MGEVPKRPKCVSPLGIAGPSRRGPRSPPRQVGIRSLGARLSTGAAIIRRGTPGGPGSSTRTAISCGTPSHPPTPTIATAFGVADGGTVAYRDVDAIDHPVPPTNHANRINYVHRHDEFELFRRRRQRPRPASAPAIERSSKSSSAPTTCITRSTTSCEQQRGKGSLYQLHSSHISTPGSTATRTPKTSHASADSSMSSQPAPEASRRVWTLPSF